MVAMAAPWSKKMKRASNEIPKEVKRPPAPMGPPAITTPNATSNEDEKINIPTLGPDVSHEAPA